MDRQNGNDNGGRLEVERQGERGGRVRKQVHNYSNKPSARMRSEGYSSRSVCLSVCLSVYDYSRTTGGL